MAKTATREMTNMPKPRAGNGTGSPEGRLWHAAQQFGEYAGIKPVTVLDALIGARLTLTKDPALRAAVVRVKRCGLPTG